MKTIIDESSVKTRCPFISAPFEDCYCSRMTSQVAEKVIKYCGGNYQECEIYRKHMRENH